MIQKIVIYWFRQDLRLFDNPALTEAAKHQSVLPIYILDDENAGKYTMGSASRWWLYYSLNALNSSLNNKLSVYYGDPQNILDDLLTRFDVEAVYWNRCYEPWRISRDVKIKKHLKSKDIAVYTYNGSLLWEPWQIKKNDGTPYKVFTPFFYRGCLNAVSPLVPKSKPEKINCIYDQNQIGIDKLHLLPRIGWNIKLEPYWHIGEENAQNRLSVFLDEALDCYKEGRDFPDKPYTSRLSPYLHFGEISSHQIWYAVRNRGDNHNIEHFCRELGWREFSYSQLYYNPTLPYQNLQSKFDDFSWNSNITHLKAWQKGNTGIPMVDAGMRELWQTGYMHNRVRMIVGSFLVKNLRLHWHYGERWFWDTLIDADLANNSASWQWIAGCGADAAPYFRIFNPVTQGQKFDPEGKYIRQYIPEIADLPNKYLFNPWECPKSILKEKQIELGRTYPFPIVDLKVSRQSALAAFQALKQK